MWLGEAPVPEHGHPVASGASSLPGLPGSGPLHDRGLGVMAWESVGSHIGPVL